MSTEEDLARRARRQARQEKRLRKEQRKLKKLERQRRHEAKRQAAARDAQDAQDAADILAFGVGTREPERDADRRARDADQRRAADAAVAAAKTLLADALRVQKQLSLGSLVAPSDDSSDALAGRKRKTRTDMDWEELKGGLTRDELHAALAEQAEIEHVKQFTRQGWTSSKGGTCWTRVHRCSFYHKAGVQCPMRLRQVVTGDERGKDDAELGEHALEQAGIPHADHHQLSARKRGVHPLIKQVLATFPAELKATPKKILQKLRESEVVKHLMTPKMTESVKNFIKKTKASAGKGVDTGKTTTLARQ